MGESVAWQPALLPSPLPQRCPIASPYLDSTLLRSCPGIVSSGSTSTGGSDPAITLGADPKVLTIAIVIFIVINGVNKLNRRPAAVNAPSPPPSRQEVLLEEIRNLLAKR
jgi:hypothetical protein